MKYDFQDHIGVFVHTRKGLIAFTKNDNLSNIIKFEEVEELKNGVCFYPAISLCGDSLITWKVPELFPKTLESLIQ